MKKLILVAALLTSTAAFADNNTNTGQGNVINNHSNNGASIAPGGIDIDTSNRNTFAPVTINDNDLKNHQAQGQILHNENDNSNKGNKQTINIKDRLQAPAVFAPGLTNGFECNGSTTLGGSVAGFGIGGGSTHANEDCVNVYLANVLGRLGDTAGAWGILCESEKIAKHSKNCLTPSAGRSNANPVASSDYPTGRPARYTY